MKKKSWEWEVKLVTESDPYIIHTDEDSALVAMENFEGAWGRNLSVYSLRKTAEIIRFDEAK
ncbi:hypothetical protein FQ087_18485 [Sporosarcina sp. ANT_H38]|uniref:hypothetical protein n=1 Tax=Sporosarcina sp. ANT_H38 TaxID=2597358 RepID=UPI0011F1F421|nr:hypothetical protein [Sporosarcina sp. ANT_H38]KAA0944113.1 hypothetical protein FQ087_18485 [Sporosarcina sp. ANT_H38]